MHPERECNAFGLGAWIWRMEVTVVDSWEMFVSRVVVWCGMVWYGMGIDAHVLFCIASAPGYQRRESCLDHQPAVAGGARVGAGARWEWLFHLFPPSLFP